MSTSINSSSSLNTSVLLSLFSAVIFSGTQKSVHRLRAIIYSSAKQMNIASGSGWHLLPCLLHCMHPPPFSQMWCNGDSSLRPKGWSIKFSARHVYWNWANQGFIKCPIRCKIHLCKIHGPAKEFSAIRLKEVTAKYFRETMFIDWDWFHPPCWSYSHTVSVSQNKIKFWLILKCCLAEPLTRWGKWVEKLLVANR